MGLTLVLIQKNSILNVEMRLVVVQVDILGKKEGTYHVVVDLTHEIENFGESGLMDAS